MHELNERSLVTVVYGITFHVRIDSIIIMSSITVYTAVPTSEQIRSCRLGMKSTSSTSPLVITLDAALTTVRGSNSRCVNDTVVQFSTISSTKRSSSGSSHNLVEMSTTRPPKRCRLQEQSACSSERDATSSATNEIQNVSANHSSIDATSRSVPVDPSTPKIPEALIGALIAPFLSDRHTFNNLMLSSRDVYRTCLDIPAPWPRQQLSCGGVVQAVTFSPSGGLLAYTSDDTVIVLLNRQTGQRLRLQAASKVTSLAFAPSGDMLASGQQPLLDNGPLSDENIAVCLWDLRPACFWDDIHDLTNDNGDSGCCCQELYQYGGAHSVSFSADGKVIASGGMDQTVHLWQRHFEQDDSVKESMSAARYRYHRSLSGLSNWIYNVKFSPNGKYLAAVGEGETEIWLWNIQQDYALTVLDDEDGKARHEETIHCIDFSANGKYLVSGSDDETIRVWDLDTLSCHRVLEGNGCPVWTLACSPCKADHSGDNTLIVSGGKDKDTGDRFLRLWSLETGETDRILRGYLDHATSVAFSPSGNTIASGSFDHQLMIHRVSTLAIIKQLRTLK